MMSDINVQFDERHVRVRGGRMRAGRHGDAPKKVCAAYNVFLVRCRVICHPEYRRGEAEIRSLWPLRGYQRISKRKLRRSTRRSGWNTSRHATSAVR